MRSDDAHRQSHMNSEQGMSKMSEVEMTAQVATNDLKRLRSDHDQAIANLAENMNRWNDTLRDLSKEFHDFQKVMNVNQQRLQSSLWDVQGAATRPSAASDSARMENSSDAGAPARQRTRPQTPAVGTVAPVRAQPMPVQSYQGQQGAQYIVQR